MSKGPQNRCPWTGETKRVINNLDDSFQTNDGSFNPESFSDCDLFDVRSIADAAGFKDWRDFRDRILTDAGSWWHVYKETFRVKRADGGVEFATIYATASNSAAAGGELYRAYQTEQRRARVFTDVSSCSVVKV